MKNNRSNSKRCNELASLISGRLLADPLSLAMYSSDASIYQIPPAAVILPANENDVITTIKFAAENQLSVIPRGGGTGLAGEAVGTGIIIDFSRFMNRILDTNLNQNTVTVEPGLVLDILNRHLASLGKKIGPDPASGNRATLGGMIGNNSTGAHSLLYGYIGRHLKNTRVISADAQSVDLHLHDTHSINNSPADQWANEIHQLLSENSEIIQAAKPTCDRNGSGYNIYPILKNGGIDLAQLIAGSEGTLAVVTRATLSLVDLPKCKALLQVNFDSLAKMARAVPCILEHHPAACELMDGRLLKLTRNAYPHYHDVLPDVEASLWVEFNADSEPQLLDNLRQAENALKGLPADSRPLTTQQIIDVNLQSRIATARNAATPLLYRDKNAAQPIPIIEDIAVNPGQLAEYLARLEEITTRLDVPVAYYAHAGDGELHTRPFLDLHKPDDVKKLKQLADETFELVWSLGGTISGEHGEGLVRASFIEKQYGPEVYTIFKKIKSIFDPHNRLNPGKIINDDPDILTKNLRFSHPQPNKNRPTNLIFRDNELTTEIEQCNGNGLCRSLDTTLSMCPIFRATGDEDASPRAKANLMRHWLYGLLDENILQTHEFKRIADLCVNCKSCARQCPSLVNIPKLMIEARAEYVKHHGLPRAQLMLTRSELMSRMGSTFAPFANLFLNTGWFRQIMEWATGIDKRRPFPNFEFGSNLKKLRRRIKQKPALANPQARLAYFVDLYATWNDHALGRAVIDILHHNNIEVTIPDQIGMALPAISYGDIPYARKLINLTLAPLAKAVRQGYKIVCSEPTAALCLKEEYLDVVDTEDARLVAENTFELTDYLADLADQGKLNTNFAPVPMKLAYHVPCHYQALELKHTSMDLLKHIPQLEIERLPVSCCGIAGTFGFQKKGFDLSMTAGAPMLNAFRDCNCQFGLTECSTCKMQMQLASGKKVLHPAKLLAKAYNLE